MLNSYRRSLSTVAAVHLKVGAGIERIPKTFPVEFKPTSIPQITQFNRNNVSVLSALSVANLSVSEDNTKMLDIRRLNSNDLISDEITKYHKSPHLITQSGVDLAEQFIIKYPRSFTMRFSDEMNEGETVPHARGVFEDLCAKQNCSAAWKLYLDSKQAGVKVSTEDQQRLLDLFCYHGYKNIVEKTFHDTDLQKEKDMNRSEASNYTNKFYFPQMYRYVEEKSIWHKGCPASEILQSITDEGSHTEFTYCTAIQSMVKFHKEDLAWKLYKNMRAEGFKPNTATYSALMCGLSKNEDMWDEDEVVFDLMKDMMSEPAVKPDGDFFYHMLNNGVAKLHEDRPAELSKKLKIIKELDISNIDIEFPTVAHIAKLLYPLNHASAVMYKMLEWLLGDQVHRLIASFTNSREENMLCVLARFMNEKALMQHQLLLLVYIRKNKMLKYFGTHFEIESNMNRLSLFPPTSTKQSGYLIYRELYDNYVKQEFIPHSRLLMLVNMIKAAILAKEYFELIPLYEECQKVTELDLNAPDVRDEERKKVQLVRVSNLFFLGIRDAYLRNHRASAHQMRDLAHQTFSSLTSNDLVPDSTALLVIVISNFYTGHHKDAFNLMDTLYAKYNIPVPYNTILGSLVHISLHGGNKGDPAEWTELNPSTQKHVKVMAMSFEYGDYNYLRNWAAIRRVVSNVDFGED